MLLTDRTDYILSSIHVLIQDWILSLNGDSKSMWHCDKLGLSKSR